MNRGFLSVCQRAEIGGQDVRALKDITKIGVDIKAPVRQKIQGYIERVGNPYLFKVNGTPVKMVFASQSAPAAEEILAKIAITEKE